jgi:hypothetical protein
MRQPGTPRGSAGATELDEIEGAAQNATTQHFLSTVAMPARERRLSASRT